MIVGIDIGTGSLKVVVTDDALALRGEAARGYAVRYPRPGWAEQDPEIWEDALGPTIAAALARADVSPGAVKALGIAGQLDGCIPVGADGQALTPCLIWIDRRAEQEVAALPADTVRDLTGVVLDPIHMAAKIRWLKRRAPEARKAARFHQPVSYLVSRLTGADVFDHGLASTTMLYALADRAFDRRLLDLFEIDENELPAIAEASSCAGRLHAAGAQLTGLLEGIPVAVGTGDDFSNPLGAGLVAPGRMACCLGTAEVVGALDQEPKVDSRGLMETHSYANDTYFIENPGWLSGGALAWFVETFRLRNFKELDELASKVCPGVEGLIFLPALGGAMAPEWQASARGCFYGLTPAHGTGHMARAVLEGCAFAMRDVLERLREMVVPVSSILLLGGGASSHVWARIRADISALPVELPVLADTSPLGAAMLAAVAGAVQPDLMAAAELVGGTAETIEPSVKAQVAYEGAYASYRRLFESVRPMFTQAP